MFSGPVSSASCFVFQYHLGEGSNWRIGVMCITSAKKRGREREKGGLSLELMDHSPLDYGHHVLFGIPDHRYRYSLPFRMKILTRYVQKKPYSAITVQIERLTGEEYAENDISGIPDLVDVIRIQDTGPTEAGRAIRKKLSVLPSICDR